MDTHGTVHGRHAADAPSVLAALQALPDTDAVIENAAEGWSIRCTFHNVTTPEKSFEVAARAVAAADAVKRP